MEEISCEITRLQKPGALVANRLPPRALPSSLFVPMFQGGGERLDRRNQNDLVVVVEELLYKEVTMSLLEGDGQTCLYASVYTGLFWKEQREYFHRKRRKIMSGGNPKGFFGSLLPLSWVNNKQLGTEITFWRKKNCLILSLLCVLFLYFTGWGRESLVT